MDRNNARSAGLGSIPAKRQFRLKPVSSTFAAWMALVLQALATPAAVVYRNQTLSDDAICTAIAKALALSMSSPAYFVSAAHLLNWVKKTAYWTTIDHFRRTMRCPERPIEYKYLDGFADPRTAHAHQQRWSAEDQKTVWLCVQLLAPLDRFLIEGRYYDRLTDRDLAKLLYATPSPSPAQGLRVWHLRKKAEKRLRQFLKQGGVAAA